MRVILVYLDQNTNEVRQIRSLDGADQLHFHRDVPNYIRIRIPDGLLRSHPITGEPLCDLTSVGDAIQQMTGHRPPNT